MVSRARTLAQKPSLTSPTSPTSQDEALGWAVAAGLCYAAYKLVFGALRDLSSFSRCSRGFELYPNPTAAVVFELLTLPVLISRRLLLRQQAPDSPASVHRPNYEHVPACLAGGGSVGARAERRER